MNFSTQYENSNSFIIDKQERLLIYDTNKNLDEKKELNFVVLKTKSLYANNISTSNNISCIE